MSSMSSTAVDDVVDVIMQIATIHMKSFILDAQHGFSYKVCYTVTLARLHYSYGRKWQDVCVQGCDGVIVEPNDGVKSEGRYARFRY